MTLRLLSTLKIISSNQQTDRHSVDKEDNTEKQSTIRLSSFDSENPQIQSVIGRQFFVDFRQNFSNEFMFCLTRMKHLKTLAYRKTETYFSTLYRRLTLVENPTFKERNRKTRRVTVHTRGALN